MRHESPRNPDMRARAALRRGLSLIEMMIALTISVTLLTATLAALDAMFKGYKQTTESASTHVVSRIVMSRLTSMIRTGGDFGPAPDDVLDDAENPIAADYFQFASARDEDGEPIEIVRIEYRVPASFAEANSDWETNPPLRTWSATTGPEDELWPADVAGELWFVRLDVTESPAVLLQENPLLTGVRSAIFTMRFGIGPKLERATIDMTIEPNDSADMTLATDSRAQTFRLVASAAPRSEN